MKQTTGFLKRHSLIIGVILIFALTWPLDLVNSGIVHIEMPFFVLLFLGWGFVLASSMMTGLTLGKAAVIALLKRYLLWRVNWKWYFVAVLLLPALQFTSVVLTAWLTGTPADYRHPMVYQVVPLSASLPVLVVPWFLFEMLMNGEEIGWRGYILPRLQAKHNALVSSLIIGLLWGIWHLPKFLGTGASSERSFAWFIAAHVALAVLYTWLYNNTRGSLLLVTLFHASGNTAGMFLPAPFAAATGGIMANLMIVLYIAAAIVVAVSTGPARLSRTGPMQVQADFIQPAHTNFPIGSLEG